MGEGIIGGDDVLNGGPGDDRLTGDASSNVDGSIAGDDILNGDEGDDIMKGDGRLYDGSIGGDDVIDGGPGDDWIEGDGTLYDTSVGGDDTITGGPGDDTLYGDAETVDATATAGSDTFVYDASANEGNDTIGDAGVNGVEDTLQFDNVADVNGGGVDLSDMEQLADVVDDGTDVTVTVYSDPTETTVNTTIVIEGIGTGGINSVAALDATAEVAVVVNP